MKTLLIICVCLLPLGAFAQLKVLTDNSVGVGSFVDPNTTFSIKNSGKKRGWYIFNQAYSPYPGARIGIHNYMTNNGNHQQIGIKNELFVDNASTQVSYGIHNISHLDGSGNLSAGIFNHTWTSPSSSNLKIGIYNVLSGEEGTGARYALYSKGGQYSGFFNGNVLVQGTLWQGSDRGLKEDIEEVNDLSEKFHQIKARKYKLKAEKDKKTHYGFVAQEIEALFPELVKEFVQPGEPIFEKQENEQGNMTEVEVGRTPDQTYKSVNYIELLPILVKVIQEQDSKIEQLNNRIKALEE